MKEIKIKCDCCGKELTTKHKTIKDVVNTGSHATLTEQLFKSEFRNEDNTQCYDMNELCDSCVKKLEENIREAIIKTINK
jgi:hypothetical protein